MSELLTIQETADRLRVSRATVYRAVKRGRLRIVKVEGASFVTAAELERYLRAAERRVA